MIRGWSDRAWTKSYKSIPNDIFRPFRYRSECEFSERKKWRIRRMFLVLISANYCDVLKGARTHLTNFQNIFRKFFTFSFQQIDQLRQLFVVSFVHQKQRRRTAHRRLVRFLWSKQESVWNEKRYRYTERLFIIYRIQVRVAVDRRWQTEQEISESFGHRKLDDMLRIENFQIFQCFIRTNENAAIESPISFILTS